MSKPAWKRIGQRGYYRYVHVASGAVIEQDIVPNNSHFSIWSIRGERLHFPTLRDAKAHIERTRPQDGGTK